MPKTCVIICAYTQKRWSQILDGVGALLSQTVAPDEILVVVDFNEDLHAALRDHFHDQQRVRVASNPGPQGLSGARNAGVALTDAAVIAFLDDDARPDRTWLANMLDALTDPAVQIVGGRAIPQWPDKRPTWFPAEFDWVVGCSHEGLPVQRSPVRNVIGCSMAFRASVFADVGGFTTTLGRVGIVPEGCEETELCIRLRQANPDAHIVYEPAATVAHTVSADRVRPKYFVSRCLAEGKSKAAVAQLSSVGESTSSELHYTVSVLPRGVLRNLRRALVGDVAGLQRAVFIVVGLALTTGSFLGHGARLRLAWRR